MALTPTWQSSLQLRSISPTRSAGAKGIVVFSGGSAANSLVDVFKHLADTHSRTLSYVIPISDNGGSSSELIRVFGGPGMQETSTSVSRLPKTDFTQALEICEVSHATSINYLLFICNQSHETTALSDTLG